ncbi:tetraacyldisaccharide 4'-kinase [Sinimarinibacterium thermocellulolyticum]|uniref:Tetraacyldisaccharide 4'-kinase n=1 Tax=Sinimarinibacterium thermocellulolyticum TaxID=3170016 RepID=A0ABV2AE52_9GAMM
MNSWLVARWYADAPAPLLLRPLASLYGRIAAQRRLRLQARAQRLGVPVIVVGNIAVGGTGKTPLVIWLVERLRAWGWRPGVVSRGYGGKPPQRPYLVRADGDPRACGDEPLLIARRGGVPVVVDPDRVAAARQLLRAGEVDVIVSDDGLQHYRLARDLEIGVVDARRGLGNGALLPAGPLREPPARLRELDLVVVNGEGWSDVSLRPLRMRLLAGEAVSGSGERRALSAFAGRRVHAVAGIGHPQRFFETLRAAGIEVIEHAFADHHRFRPQDLAFADTLPLMMTEKDAVKCAGFFGADWWVLPVSAHFDAADERRVRESVERLRTDR